MNSTTPFNLAGTERTDQRPDWVGSERAAELMAVARTTTWRLARKWAAMQEAHETPPVRVLVFGTLERPDYRYYLPDLLVYARERQQRKSERWRKQMKRFDAELRELADFVREHQAGGLPVGPPPLPHLPRPPRVPPRNEA